MGTTIPRKFDGVPTLTPVKVDTITQWYHSALGDADKAGDMDDAYYYEGLVSGFESTLDLLYEAAEEAAKVVKTGHGGFKRAVIITGVVGLVYIYLKNDKQIKASVKRSRDLVKDVVKDAMTYPTAPIQPYVKPKKAPAKGKPTD